jgi:serine/threonine protein kinase
LYQIINGLDILHKNNYIHQDIKPDNILVYEGGIIKIGDFGISKKAAATINTLKSTGGKSQMPVLVGTLFIFLSILYI